MWFWFFEVRNKPSTAPLLNTRKLSGEEREEEEKDVEMPSCKTPQGLKTHAPNSPPPSPQPATPNRTSRSRPPTHTPPCRVVSHSTLGTARHRPIGRGRCLFGGEITHEKKKNTIRRQFCRRTCYIGFCTRRCTQMELKKKNPSYANKGYG